MITAFLFPGQGSQKPGMGAELRAASDAAKQVFDQVSAAIGRDVAALCDSDEETLRRTENTQPALYTCGVAAAAALREKGVSPDYCAGHSVGEYAALAAAGVLAVDDGAKLVARRGELMAEAKGGSMAAVLGLDDATVERICSDAAGTVMVANYNCPGQVVISGEPAAVAAASDALTAAGAKRVMPLNVSGGFHSPLMHVASRDMAEALGEAEFRPTKVHVVSNVTGQFLDDPEDWPELLTRQLFSPVRWTTCMRTLLGAGADRFLECGVGNVLCGLMKRIGPDATCLRVDDAAALRAATEA